MKIERPIEQNDNFTKINENVICVNNIGKTLCENYNNNTNLYNFPVYEKEVKYYPQCACYKKKDFLNEKIKIMDNSGESEFVFYRSDYEDRLKTKYPLSFFDAIFFDKGFLFIAANDDIQDYSFYFYDKKCENFKKQDEESLYSFLKTIELFICMNNLSENEDFLSENDFQEIYNHITSEKRKNTDLFRDIETMLTK